MNRRPATLIVALLAVVAVAAGFMSITAMRRTDVAQKTTSVTHFEPGPSHKVPETSLASDDQARTFAHENAIALARWIALPPDGLFTTAASPDVSVTALGEGNKPSWAGTWTVTVASSEVPAFKQTYTQSMTFGPGAASQPDPGSRQSGELDDPLLFQRMGELSPAERVTLLRFVAARGNPVLRSMDVLSEDVGQTSGLTDKQRFFRDRLLALGVARGFVPTHLVWLSFDDPAAADATPLSLLVGYSAKLGTWKVLGSAHGTYEGKFTAAK